MNSAFEDRWSGGTQNFLAWMEDKLRECQSPQTHRDLLASL